MNWLNTSPALHGSKAGNVRITSIDSMTSDFKDLCNSEELDTMTPEQLMATLDSLYLKHSEIFEDTQLTLGQIHNFVSSSVSAVPYGPREILCTLYRRIMQHSSYTNTFRDL
jgi:hypothetical protein